MVFDTIIARKKGETCQIAPAEKIILHLKCESNTQLWHFADQFLHFKSIILNTIKKQKDKGYVA